MTVELAGTERLDEVRELWLELHHHHQAVVHTVPLVQDDELSWRRRRALYAERLDAGTGFLVLATDADAVVGYALVCIEEGPDDTFDVNGGIAEVVTLIVTREQRSTGVGRVLLEAAEAVARDRGFDTMKIAVMSGNVRAREFYENHGYLVGEHVLYRKLDHR